MSLETAGAPARGGRDAGKNPAVSALTLGPVLFHWPVERKRDFYFAVADEAPVDTVYVGEVVCCKRTPAFEPYLGEVVDRLRRAGKSVVRSTLAEVMLQHDRDEVRRVCSQADTCIEANDASALYHLAGRQHAVGPFLNVYNEASLEFLAQNGATHFTLPPELPRECLTILAAKARELGVTLEVQIYGRVPLALSARCYHARAHGLARDTCQFACEADPDGLALRTRDGRPFLAINGLQTLSFSCINLMRELAQIQGMGISALRLSPHAQDMLEVARIYRGVLDGEISPEEGTARLPALGPGVPFANGFYHKREGYRWLA